MSQDFWNVDEGEFRDIPEEVVEGDSAPAVNVRSASPAPHTKKQIAVQEPVVAAQQEQDETEDDEDDFSAVLSDARLRLEQGRLYEMIMNNDLFEGTEADPIAIKSVQKQIRNFAKERMEIMLGMRQEQSELNIPNGNPFNDLEVEVLKALASAATDKATEKEEAQVFTSQPTTQRQGLKPINLKLKSNKQTVVAKPAVKASSKPLEQKASAPVTRNKKNEAYIDQILREEGISREAYERQYNPKYKSLHKPLEQMSEAEIKEWKSQDALKTNRQVKSSQAIPMPTPEQEGLLHAQRAHAAEQNPQMQTIMNLLANKKK